MLWCGTGLWVAVASGTGICDSSARPSFDSGPATSVPVVMRYFLSLGFRMAALIAAKRMRR